MVRAVALAMASLGAVEAARMSKVRRSCGAGPSTANNSIQIVNGDDAEECAWKWQVGLRDGPSGLPWCGGTIINEEWVFTAAHCGNAPTFHVVAGAWKPRQGSVHEQNRRAVQLFRHPLYSASTTSHDYALVRVDRPFEFNSCVGAACLPEGNGDDVEPGTKCWITGWGTLSSGGRQPDILQKGEVSIISNAACVGDFGYTSSQIDDSMMCAQGRTSSGAIIDACQGDSGGPLVCETGGSWTLYGATSWGRGCAGRRWPGIWARVHEVMDWVESVLAENDGPAPPPPPMPQCPDFAVSPRPDSDGECQCTGGQFCSRNGVDANCPTSNGPGGWGGTWFDWTCEECRCYSL